jgi:uncharacterized phage protein (TIGR01671 family)
VAKGERMMEIKVRVWDGKEYRYPPPLGEWDFEDCELFAGYTGKTKIIEQFTGLIDKNGKEIYEGDIFKWWGYEVRENKQIRPERICLVIRDIYDLEKLQNVIKCNDMGVEIIGNIHETPELLPNS